MRASPPFHLGGSRCRESLLFSQSQNQNAREPSGLRIKRIQAKGQDVDTLQAKFDDIVREVEMKLLEAAIDYLRS